MIVLPAIDLQAGQVVRLKRGDFSGKIIYSNDPIGVAKDWERQGATWLHVVDLDGAMTGEFKNLNLIGNIGRSVGCAIELGGGIRRRQDIQEGLAQGANRIILGTKAAEDQVFLKKVVKEFGKKIAVAVDAQNEKVVTRGWTHPTELDVLDFTAQMEGLGVSLIVVTDVNKDGMLAGPNLDLMEQVLKKVKIQVIASGGVSSLEDIHLLSQLSRKYLHLHGAIVGKALYEKKFTVKEAIEAC